jgi:hypothetical protein
MGRNENRKLNNELRLSFSATLMDLEVALWNIETSYRPRNGRHSVKNDDISSLLL